MHALLLIFAATVALASAPAQGLAAGAPEATEPTAAPAPAAGRPEGAPPPPRARRSSGRTSKAASSRSPTPPSSAPPTTEAPAPPGRGAAGGGAESKDPIPAVANAASGPPPDPSRREPENLLAGPARCVLRYLEAVRLAGPRPEARTGRLPPAHEKDYTRVRALTAPRTLEEITRRAGAGEEHPLAPWQDAARAHVLESFQLIGVRRAPRGAAVVTVAETFWRPPGAELERRFAEYLVGRVDGQWKVVDRSPGQAFDDGVLQSRYAGFFDDPAAAR
jgi:hypothetical protein